MSVTFSDFARSVKTETAFDVLAIARKLQSEGKDVIELEIGDSPFPTTGAAAKAGIAAIEADQCHYGPSNGLPDFRAAAAEYVNREHGLNVSAENIVAGPGAKNFEQLFCEAFLNPNDGVLVFSPHFPTYIPNIDRRNARITYSPLTQENHFRPNLLDVRKFLTDDASPKAIFMNSPHNPTGGVATEEDIRGIADLIRDTNTVLFSDEPYDQMVWEGQHYSPLAEPGMLDQCVAAYTFSKSFSMSGWRLGFAVSSVEIINILSKLTNTCLSCVPPFVQIAGAAALRDDLVERDKNMADFKVKVADLVNSLNQLDGVDCLMPGGTFYVFPRVKAVCDRLKITSHGLALYLLTAADDERGVACLGGECFGEAGNGFLRLSCAEPNERLQQAVEFMASAFQNTERVEAYLEANPHHRA